VSGSITLAAWIRLDRTSSFAQPIVGKSDWRGIDCPGGSTVIRNYQLTLWSDGSLAFGFAPDASVITAHLYTSSASIDDVGLWQHVAATFTYGIGSSVQLYLDGDPIPGGWTFGNGNNTPYGANDTPVQIGSDGCGGQQNFPGIIDEVSIWQRALAAAEVRALYARGARNLAIQVRSCALDDCSDGLFVGPDGDPGSYYSELDNHDDHLPSFDLVGVPDNQYFQYQVTFESELPGESPELRVVQIMALSN
jgi:hypothetical protein